MHNKYFLHNNEYGRNQLTIHELIENMATNLGVIIPGQIFQTDNELQKFISLFPDANS